MEWNEVSLQFWKTVKWNGTVVTDATKFWAYKEIKEEENQLWQELKIQAPLDRGKKSIWKALITKILSTEFQTYHWH